LIDSHKAVLVASLLLAIAVKIMAGGADLINQLLSWRVNWAPIQRACLEVGLDVGCVLALAG
jgi:hypothetical protein